MNQNTLTSFICRRVPWWLVGPKVLQLSPFNTLVAGVGDQSSMKSLVDVKHLKAWHLI